MPHHYVFCTEVVLLSLQATSPSVFDQSIGYGLGKVLKSITILQVYSFDGANLLSPR